MEKDKYVIRDRRRIVNFIQDSILPEKTTLTNIDIRDKDDIVIISSVLSGNAEKFVAGDKELLELGIVKSMQIVSPRMFWEALKTQSLSFFQLGL